MFLMSKLELNMPLGLQQLIRRKALLNKRLSARKANVAFRCITHELSLRSFCSHSEEMQNKTV